ncbi:MAG: class IV adenylate cyclase [Bacilli bacterium]|nr:class IV adenylate cyclase [Bacilli bacterium]
MSNIEIERKYRINKEIFDKIQKYFDDKKIVGKVEKQNDVYFSPSHFPFFGGNIDNEALRIRILDNKNILSYKKFYYATEDAPAHSDEHEIEIDDIDKMKLILKDLRINEAFTLKKERTIYLYDGIEVSLDIVENLGYFVELEIKNQDDIGYASKVMQILIESFSITEDMRNYEGYSYLLFNANNN